MTLYEEYDHWDEVYNEELEEIAKIEEKGHSRHCAERQVWGDGQCECQMGSNYDPEYDPYAWSR